MPSAGATAPRPGWRDAAQEGDRGCRARRADAAAPGPSASMRRRLRRAWASVAGRVVLTRVAGPVERDLDRPVRVGPVRPAGQLVQPIERRRRRVAVRIAGARRDDGDPRTHRLEEWPRARGARAVVRDLEQVDRGEPSLEQLRIDALLDVAGEQEPMAGDLAQQDDRDVVDRRPAVRRSLRNPVRVRPEHPEVDRIELQPIAGREAAVRRPALSEHLVPGSIAGSGPDHARLVHPADAVALEQQREPGDVVLVRMRQHQDVDPAVPRRQALVERDQQPAGIGPAIDDHPAAARRPRRGCRRPGRRRARRPERRRRVGARRRAPARSLLRRGRSPRSAAPGSGGARSRAGSARQPPWPAPQERFVTCVGDLRRARSRRPATNRSPQRAAAMIRMSDATALTRSHGGASSRLASGSAAPARTTATIAAYSAHAGSPTTVATTAGSPKPTSTPTTSASAPVAIAGGTSGTTIRFTAGATSDSRPKSSSTIGVVAACAANETPRISATQRRGSAGLGTGEPRGHRRAPGDDPGCREDGQPEAGVVDVPRDRARAAPCTPSRAPRPPCRAGRARERAARRRPWRPRERPTATARRRPRRRRSRAP